ncbi:la-related protein 6C-like [Lolium rigidum]|uniref:la-related protein 6C-like n=1 Tax=Lolium rigidum TaxID=89674 RepID=UPI001F5D9ED8|nr:la-related protein 6C-like [Lolium rigidum]
MAQDNRDSSGASSSTSGLCTSECSTPFKFNVHAPEFVPMSSPLTVAGYFSPFVQLSGAGSGIGLAADWSFFGEPEPTSFFMAPGLAHVDIGGLAGGSVQPKGASPADIAHKIVKQVEYQFSDTNLIANDFLMKIMNKDPEGYVPMSVISSWKKIKAMGVTSQLLVKALRTSEKLVVSDDGKKVRRAQPFTERHKEELQSRMIIAENLPEDSTRNSLEKIFGMIGSVKNIRICHPQEPSTARSSKPDTLVRNKLHALIEYESAQQAEKAVGKLNDERNWRKGLRVRPVLRRSVTETHQRSDTTGPWGRGRVRPHATTAAPPHAGAAVAHLESLITRPQGPRMPDGTRGFTMGRGRPSLLLV